MLRLVATAIVCALQLQPLECSSLFESPHQDSARLKSESWSVSQGRKLLNAGDCNRGAINYAISGSPFLASSISFDPIRAGAYTETIVLFRLNHVTCRGDKIRVQLPDGFTFVPPPGSAIDPDFFDTGTDAQFSKYSGAWDGTATRLIFTYLDSSPTPAAQRQYVSLAASSGLRLPSKGLPSNASGIQIAITQGAPSTASSSFYPFVTTQASVFVSNVSVHVASADTLSDIFAPFPYRSWWCSNFSCSNCSVWHGLQSACGGPCADETVSQHQKESLCKQWRYAQTNQSSTECFPATTAVPSACHAFLKYCGAGDGACPPLTNALVSSSTAAVAFAEGRVVAEPGFSGYGRSSLRPVSGSHALLQIQLSLNLALMNDDIVYIHLPGFYCSPCNRSHILGETRLNTLRGRGERGR